MTIHGEAISHILAMVPPRVATPNDDMLNHVRSALLRGLHRPQLCRPHTKKLSVAGGGPSLNVSEIDRDSVIVTVNAGLSHLLDNGITPWACGLLDARPHIADLIEPHPDVFYFVASTCHPSVFDKLKDCKVVLWHPTGLPGIESVVPEGHDLISGASTMGLRWLNLAHYMGFRNFDFHGLDSSYAGDRTHAYADYRDGRAGSIEIDGYVTDNNFLEQVKDWFQLQELFKLDPEPPITRLYGDGLLQHSVRKREALIANWPRRPETKPLNVICVATGNYLGRGEDYVSHLLAGIAKNYEGKCKFHVIRNGPESWWAKLLMFESDRFPKGERCVYFDLDTIITGKLDDLLSYDGPFAALRDPWQPGQINSSVMTWTAGECDHVWRAWHEAGAPTDDPRGDQAFIGQHMPMAVRLQDVLPGQLVSYKAQCGAGVPAGAHVVFYHGQPRPHETALWNGDVSAPSGTEFWKAQNGLRHVTPQGKFNPEGPWLEEYLKEIASHGRVLEFGCGPGRIAGCFDPESYIGVDINPRSIEHAQTRNPAHTFELIQDELPEADVCLFHTVLLHVPDNEIDGVLTRLRTPVVYVSEMLGREWRRGGDPPVFNRELQEYVTAFAAHGYVLDEVTERDYEHYNKPMAILKFKTS